MSNNLPKEFRLARLVGKAHEQRAIERACKYAAKVSRPVYAFRTPRGWCLDTAAPLGECFIALPSGVVQKFSAPVV